MAKTIPLTPHPNIDPGDLEVQLRVVASALGTAYAHHAAIEAKIARLEARAMELRHAMAARDTAVNQWADRGGSNPELD